MKKSLSVVLSVALVSSMFASMAFADGATTTSTSTSTSATATTQLDAQGKYDALKALGVFEGDENGANLEGNMTRAQFAKILVKVFGLTEDSASASVYKDLDGAGWAAGYIGAATKAGLMDGVWEGQFAPSGDVTLEQLATVVVRGFNLDHSSTDGVTGASDWAKGYVKAAVGAGLISATADFTVSAKRSDLVNTAYTSVQKVKEEQAAEAAKQVAPLDVKSAVALNSKVVEVVLNTAPKAADLVASNVTVKDAAGTAVAVSGVAAAPYVTDGKTVLVTLGADTTAGTLYTLTSGTKSSNFGGKVADSAAPKVTAVAVNDYNEVELTFSEPVDISKLAVTAAEKYGTQAALNVTGLKYDTSSKVKVTTDAQKGATLYGLAISGATDFAGNAMTADNAQTFVGTAMDTAANTIAGIQATNSKTVKVTFNKKIDSTTSLDAANYAIAETYGNKTAIAVSSVAAVSGDAKSVNLTLASDTSAATLYTLTVSNVKTLYGTALSAAINSTFVGVAKDTTALTAPVAASTNNTTITLTFGAVGTDSVDTAVTADMFTIAEAYGNQAALAVKSVSVKDNVVTLTTDPQTVALYNVTVKTGIKDITGNATTADLKTTVVGKAVASAIGSISSAQLDPGDTTNTSLVVTFNQNVGASASDVSHYSIDGGVGYPAKAVAGTGANANQVTLTIPTTKAGQLYNLTVTGLENSDGVAMAAAGVKGTFVGAGVTATKPVLSGVVALDNQTIKVFFDRAVTDTSVAGQVWDSGNHTVKAGVWNTYTNDSTALSLLDGATANADPSNANALIIRSTANRFATATATTAGTYTLVGTAGLFKDTSSNSKVFAATNTAATKITATAASGLNKRTVRVYFNQAVSINTQGTIDGTLVVSASKDGSAPISLSKGTAIDSSKTVYDFYTSSDLGSQAYYLVYMGGANVDSLYGGTIAFADEDTATGTQQVRQFAGNGAAAGVINSVPVTMSDARTIVIWYPEAMDQTAAKDLTKIDVVAGDGTTSLTNSRGYLANSSYDAATNKVTITLNHDLTASTTGYYLKWVDNTVTNAVGAKAVVNSDASSVKTQIAPSTTAAAKVTVTKATYDKTAGTVTITLSQNVKGTGTVNQYPNAGALSDLDIYVDGSSTKLAAVAGTAVTTTQINGINYFNTIVVTLQPGAVTDAAKIGKVAIDSGANLTGINGMGVDTASSVVFAQQ